MKKLIAVLMLAAFAGTTLEVAAQTPATPATPAQSATPATPAKAESKKTHKSEGKKKAKAKAKKAESKGYAAPALTGRAIPERRDLPPFCFCAYNRGPDPIRALLKSPSSDPIFPLTSLSTRRPKP